MSGDLGEDWVSPGRGSRSGASGGAGSRVAADLEGRSSYWSVVLQSFPANTAGHRARAAELVRRLMQLDPTFRAAFVHTDSRGSMALLGQHASVDDPGAQEDLAFVKGFSPGGQSLFPRALLSRIRLQRDPSSYGPTELLSARVTNPQVRDMYTFQVGVWGTFPGDPERRSWADVRRAAELNVAQLRSQGYQAYYHHDDDKELSMVTIGLFDRSAYDAQGGLYLSPQLERLSRQFTIHRINGVEQVMVEGNREIPQPPTLVEVPQLP